MDVRIGAVVTVCELKKRTDLNGRQCVVEGWVEQTGRFSVRDVETSKVYAIRERNLRTLSDTTASNARTETAKSTTDDSNECPRRVVCPLCKKQIIAQSEAECTDHMKVCPAFASLYGDGDVSLEKQSDAVIEGLTM
eukprot:g1850.t1